jgi:hypothetical protein
MTAPNLMESSGASLVRAAKYAKPRANCLQVCGFESEVPVAITVLGFLAIVGRLS